MTDVIATSVAADPRFASGVQEFNGCNYFEAHEIWEDLWNDLVGEPKQVCQGLIQVAVGYHKLSIGNSAGARKLLERGVRGLTACVAARDRAINDFVSRVNADLDTLRRGGVDLPGAHPTFPNGSR